MNATLTGCLIRGCGRPCIIHVSTELRVKEMISGASVGYAIVHFSGSKSYRHRGFLKPLRLFETAYDIEKLRMKLSNSTRTFFVLDPCYVAFIQNKLDLIWIVKYLIHSIS